MAEQIIQIRQKLELLRSLDSDFRIFGASVHKYQLNPILTLETIDRFQRQFNIELPEGFTTFLTMVGDGGAGPYYGLQPLDQTLFADLDYPKPDDLLDPSLPFPHTTAWNDEFTATISEDEDEAAYERQSDAFYERYLSKSQMNGVLAICNYGCGISLNLVVNGKEYGNIWTDDRGNDGGIYPSMELGNDQKIGFMDWYELWLDNSITEIRSKISDTQPTDTNMRTNRKPRKPWWRIW